MKHIKYPFYNNVLKSANKLRFKNLDKEAQRNNIKHQIFVAFLAILYFVFVISFILLIKYLKTIIESSILKALMMIGMILVTIVVPILLVVLVYCLFEKHIPTYTVGKLRKEYMAEITEPLKKHYKVCEPMLITKCYRSTNELFNNKDVMIYLYKDEIRITLDFNHTYKDLGCYAFKLNEINCLYIKENKLTKCLLKTSKVEFELGRLTKPFIRKIIEDCH